MRRTLQTIALVILTSTGTACAGGGHNQSGGHDHSGGFAAPSGGDTPAFDIIHTRITTKGNRATFHMAVTGTAGAVLPKKAGQLAGASVYSYVWPTSLDPATVGFDAGAGILAFAVTVHPDFDDTPLFDESADGDLGNDGGRWHSHWVVLGPDKTCGPAALKVIDIPKGTKPALPATWPGLPILIDSPGWTPVFSAEAVEVTVPFANIGALKGAHFDGVTAGLRVNQSVHAPLLCVIDLFDVASGDLSSPGVVNE